jgi:hypothetical protein
MISAAKRGLAHRTQYNFYMATTVLTIKRVSTVNNNFITLLLPDISYGLSSSADNQSRVSIIKIYAIATCLSSIIMTI